MAYNNFTVEEAEEKFGLVFKSNHFLPALDAVFPSDWLKVDLIKNLAGCQSCGFGEGSL